jgi:hypothetical protein
MAKSLETTIQECWQIAEDHGFHGVDRTFGDTCTLIHSEISEAYEAFRKDGRHSFYTEVDGKPEGSGVELLDAVIRIFDTLQGECGLTAVQVAIMLDHKMEYNRTRPFLHGKVI